MLSRIFVYGTLMEGMENYALIKPYVISVKPAVLPGAKLFHLDYGYPAVVLTGTYSCVRGQVIELCDMGRALPILDELEDFHGEGHPDNLYDRRICSVDSPEAGSTEAYVYVWAQPDRLSAVGAPVQGGCWRSYLQAQSAKY